MGKRRKMTSSYHSGAILLHIFLVPLMLMVGAGVIPTFVILSESGGRKISYQSILLGIACLAWAVIFFLKWKNVRITVSDEGVTYTTHFGTTHTYTWENDSIKIIDQSPRANRLLFELGGRTIRLNDDATNFRQMRGWLRNNGYLVDEAGEPVISGSDADSFEILEITHLSDEGEPGRDAVLH